MKCFAISPLLAVLAVSNLAQASPLSYLWGLTRRDLEVYSLPNEVKSLHGHVHEIRAKKKAPEEPEPPKYGEVQNKGAKLASALSNPDCPIPAKDVDYAQLQEEDWDLDEKKVSMYFNLRGVTVDLGLPDGKVYTQVTAEIVGGNGEDMNSYQNYVGGGGIFALSNSRVDGHAWSDIAYAVWKEFDGSDLNYVFRVDVVNGVSKDLITAEIYPANGETWPQTEPKEWLPETDEYNAIMGTPNGSGVAYLLLNHRADFGSKTVTKITTWAGGSDDHLQIMFSLG